MPRSPGSRRPPISRCASNLLPTRVRACTCSRPSLSRVSPSPLAVQAQVTGSSRLLRHCRLRALHKRHWSLCRNKGKTLVQTHMHRRGMGIFACLVCSTRRVPRRVVDNAEFTGEGIFQEATRACFGGTLCCISSPYDVGSGTRGERGRGRAVLLLGISGSRVSPVSSPGNPLTHQAPTPNQTDT